MTHTELLAGWMVQLWDESRGRTFSAYMLQSALWQWWNAQAFRLEGMVVDRRTHKAHRLTSHIEMRGPLQFRIYTIGNEVKR